MKIRIAILPLLLLLLPFGSRQSDPSDFVGKWIGWADGQIPFTMDVTLEDESMTAVVNAPEQGMVDLTSDNMEVANDEMQVSFEMADGSMLLLEGKLNEEGVLEGQYTLGEQVGSYTANKQKAVE